MYQFGKKIKFTLFGTSHGPCVGGILEGIPSNIEIDFNIIKKNLDLRKPSPKIGTSRVEEDIVEFIDGFHNSVTDGGPILFVIKNQNVDNSAYRCFEKTPRPGHSDLPASVKFPEHDINGGGQFSGRLTVPIVVAGSIAKHILSKNGIEISSFSRSIGNVEDKEYRDIQQAKLSEKYASRACTKELDNLMVDEIIKSKNTKDSVGGVIECIVTGLPLGFGGIWFEALDSEIAHAIFSIPACKGIEFGKGFELSKMKGSKSNDAFIFDEGVSIKTNNMGGILGGMSDGSPLIFRAVFKPTPSIGKKQETINLETMENCIIEIEGRHDPCIVPRATIIVEMMTALVILDQLVRE